MIILKVDRPPLLWGVVPLSALLIYVPVSVILLSILSGLFHIWGLLYGAIYFIATIPIVLLSSHVDKLKYKGMFYRITTFKSKVGFFK